METPPGAQVSGKLNISILSGIDRINKINNVVWMVLGDSNCRVGACCKWEMLKEKIVRTCQTISKERAVKANTFFVELQSKMNKLMLEINDKNNPP